MANYAFTADLIADVLFRAGEPASNSDFAAQVLIYLNRAYQTLYMGGGDISNDLNEDFWWAKKSANLILNAPITGNVTVTNGSINITFSVAPSISLVGYRFRVNNSPDFFTIATHTAATTAATLDSVYTGPNAAATPYTALQYSFTLPADHIRIAAPMRVFQGSETFIDGVERSALERDYPLSQIQAGVPTEFAYASEVSIIFNKSGPVPNTTPNSMRVEFEYIYRPADLTSPGTAELPIVPAQYRKVIADLALTYLFIDKNDDRANAASALAKRGIQGMVAEQRSRMVNYSRSLGLILPRTSRNKNRFPLRSESGFIIG